MLGRGTREGRVSIVTGEWVTHCPAAGVNVGVEVGVGRGKPRSSREPLPSSLETPSQQLLPVASELCCSPVNHTKAWYTELLCWALLLGCSHTPTPVPAKSKAPESCREVLLESARQGGRKCCPDSTRMCTSGLSPEPHKSKDSQKHSNLGFEEKTNQDRAGTRAAAPLLTLALGAGDHAQ